LSAATLGSTASATRDLSYYVWLSAKRRPLWIGANHPTRVCTRCEYPLQGKSRDTTSSEARTALSSGDQNRCGRILPDLGRRGQKDHIKAIHESWARVAPSDIEHSCVAWRWRLKGLTHRLRQVHGDFHPWNILFRSETDFALLDRSRGEYGDPADDVTSLTLNYLFFSLQRSGRLQGSLERLFLRFWERYLEKSVDREILRVVAPFFAFRGLVMASPLWYPSLPDTVREKLLTFMVAVLQKETFDPSQVNAYCGA
jgi:Phosphotransferase enzyme family